jgi:hypothetical protein
MANKLTTEQRRAIMQKTWRLKRPEMLAKVRQNAVKALDARGLIRGALLQQFLADVSTSKDGYRKIGARWLVSSATAARIARAHGIYHHRPRKLDAIEIREAA